MIPEDEAHSNATSGWRIDKRIPVSMLAAILMQSVAVVIWAMSLESRVLFLEKTAINGEQITTIRLDVASMKQDVLELKDDLRRLAARGNRAN